MNAKKETTSCMKDEELFETFATPATIENGDSDQSQLEDYHQKVGTKESHPSELLDIPGVIRDVANYTSSVAPRPNKALAFAGAVSLVAALSGRIYTDRFNSRTNLYMIAIAGSGTGKNSPRATNQQIFKLLELNEIGSVFGTGEGLEDLIKSSPRHLFQTDEIDGMIEALSSGTQNHLTTLSSKLLQFFTDSAGVYTTRPLSGKPPSMIFNPSLCIFGTATPHAFYNSISDCLGSAVIGFWSELA